MEPELVDIIISRTSGLTLMEFAKRHLFEPLEITNYEWYIKPNGGGYAAGSFFMRPIDMLKIAQWFWIMEKRTIYDGNKGL